MSDAREKLEWLFQRVWFRAIFAVMLVAMHVGDVRSFAKERFNQPFNRDPDHAPSFGDEIHEPHAAGAKRLAVSRWDGEHYIALALRGYSACPLGPMTDADIKRYDGKCTLTFYPGYPLIGRYVARVFDLPMDYALWYVSLLASLVTFFLWTSPTMTARFGTVTAWLSLIVLNAYPASCYSVFVATEPCALLFVFSSYVAFARRYYLLAASLMGAASAIRITTVAGSIALCAALLVETIRKPPTTIWAWLSRVSCFPVSAWGGIAVMAFFWSRFDDPLIYTRAHGAIYMHHPSISQLLDPKPVWIMHAIDGAVHDGVWAIGLLLWFLLGARVAFRHLPVAERIFLYGLVLMTYALTIYGSLEIFLGGMSRYVLIAFPLFLCVASMLRKRPFVLVLWLALCRWHYTEADLCYYVGDVGPAGLVKCNMTQWVNW